MNIKELINNCLPSKTDFRKKTGIELRRWGDCTRTKNLARFSEKEKEEIVDKLEAHRDNITLWIEEYKNNL